MHLQKAIAILCVPLAMALIGASGLAGKGVGGVQTTGLPPPPTTGSPTSTTGTPTTTTGTPTTSTSTTSGSSGDTTGSGVWSGTVYYHRLYEQQSVPIAYKRSGSSVVSATNQHAILLRVVLPSVIPPGAPYELLGVTHDVSMFGDGALVSRSDNGSAPVYEAAIPKTGTTSPTTEAGMTFQDVTAPGHVLVGLTSPGALSGGSLRLTFRKKIYVRKMVSGVWQYETWHSGTYADLDVAKLVCADAAIDTRRGHGQPNLAGELPGDPNAPARPINFGAWNYRGGLFVGNMPVLTGDQSGLARTQLYVPSGGQGSLRLATLSLYDFGSPANAYGLSLGAYLPSASDPNLNVGESTLTWDSKWTSIAPRDTIGSPPDDARDPISKLDLTGAGGDYRNLPLQRTDSLPPTMALSRICLAMTAESFEDGPYWRYFGSNEYASGFTTFPRNDSGPRVWRLGEQSLVTW